MKLTKIALKQKTSTTEAMGVVYEQLFFDGFCFRQGLNLRTSGYEPNQFSVISVAAFSASNVYI